MTQFISIIGIAVAVTVDNALLTGLILPPHVSHHSKKVMLTVLGILLGLAQIGLAVSVDQLMHSMAFRVAAIVILSWMCIRTLGMMAQTRHIDGFVQTLAKLWFYTVFGNIDNMIWLGSELRGDRLWLVISSLVTIPLFVLVGLFLSDQIEKQQWILPLGAGMMAWAAASLFLDLPFAKAIVLSLDDAPRTTLQCLITIAILGIGFGVRRLFRARPLL